MVACSSRLPARTGATGSTTVFTGSACHSGAVKPSHAITTLGYGLDDARSVLRFSMLPDVQTSEVEALAAAIKRLT